MLQRRAGRRNAHLMLRIRPTAQILITKARTSACRTPRPQPFPSHRSEHEPTLAFDPLLALAAAIGLALPLGTRPADAQTKLKMVLNWKYQGPQGMFFLAEDKGYFKAEGLDVTIDQGNGSGAAVPLVANGTYDVGFGDINALIELAAKKPDEAPIAVYVHVQPAAFHRGGEGRQPDQDAEGFRRQDARRRRQ